MLNTRLRDILAAPLAAALVLAPLHAPVAVAASCAWASSTRRWQRRRSPRSSS